MPDYVRTVAVNLDGTPASGRTPVDDVLQPIVATQAANRPIVPPNPTARLTVTCSTPIREAG